MKQMKSKYYLLLVLSLNISLLLNAQSSIIPYSLPDNDGQFFSVKVNGIDIPVKSFKDFEYIHFAMSESAEIVITAPDSIGTISSYRIRPERRDIPGRVQDNTLSFTIDKPQQLVININFLKKLMIFADPPEVDPPSLSDAHVVNIMDYGVDATGGSLITTKFQQAINELPAGGTLYFPAGLYRTGSFNLKGNMTLYLAPGALIKGSENNNDIKFLPPSYSVLYFLKAEDANNLTIRGRGALDGNGKVVRTIYDAENGGNKVPGRLVYIKNSECFSLKGVFLRDSYSWNTNLVGLNNVHINRVKIINDFTLSNGDGLDVDGCVSALVENSFIYAEDDAISPKATTATTVNPENQIYRNCVLWSNNATGIRLGTETKCDNFSDFLFENIDILHSATMLRLFTFDNADFRDFTFRNIWVEDYAMYDDPVYDEYPPRTEVKSGNTYLVYIYDKTTSAMTENIRFENFVSMGLHIKSLLYVPGATTTRIDSVQFVNFIVGNDTLINNTDAKVDLRSGVGTVTFSKGEEITATNPFEGREISKVTFDPGHDKNKITWDKVTGKNISSYNIYSKNGGNFQLIGSKDFNSSAEFVDQQSSPDTEPATYSITYINGCGEETEYGPTVSTIFLEISEDSAEGEVTLSWTKYKAQTNSLTPDYYYIWKGESSTFMTIIDSIPGDQEPKYIDENYPEGTVFYQLEIRLPTAKSDNQVFSNMVAYDYVETSVVENQIPFRIYPNPTNDILNIIAAKPISSIRLYNSSGKMVKTISTSGSAISIDVSSFVPGLYFVDILFYARGAYREKILIE